MRAGAIVLAIALLAGCSGFNQARQMTPQELAGQNDAWICDYLETFAYKGRIPDAWEAEALKRNLTGCIERGLERRAEDRELDRRRPALCPQGTATQDSRCW